jgi:transcriptional regulator with XRE-family HTH domain
MPRKNSIGLKLRNLREERGDMILDDLHDKTGINKSTLSQYENDKAKPTERHAMLLGELFEVDWTEFCKKPQLPKKKR